jgi:hypothetical protein
VLSLFLFAARCPTANPTNNQSTHYTKRIQTPPQKTPQQQLQKKQENQEHTTTQART